MVASAGDGDLVFVGRSPESLYDYLGGILAETSWKGALYSMSDADFVAAVEAVRPCFLALVEAGTIEEYELPSEIAHLECFEGRNWYNVFDDPEFDTRYYACLDAANSA